MLNKIDPGRRLRAKIENTISYTAQITVAAAYFLLTNRKIGIAVATTAICFVVFEAGFLIGQVEMRAKMRAAANSVAVLDCETIVVPTDQKNTTELYALCD